MASTQSKLFNFFLKFIGKKNFLRRQLAAGRFDFLNCPQPPRKLYRSFHIRKFQLNGRNVFSISPKNKDNSGKHILYLHGGAYVQNFVVFHWDFIAEMIRRLDCTIIAPDYPLAPANTYEQSFEMLTALYSQTISKVKPADLVLMGDSAGGGLALALAQKMRIENNTQPGQIILLSPWLDITLANPDIKDLDPLDPFLGTESLRQAGRLYAGNTKPDHYLLSPINGPLDNLGKLSVFIGSKEILVADARKLKSLAASKKIDINYYEYPGMVHAWMLLNLPESKKAKEQIIKLIRNEA